MPFYKWEDLKSELITPKYSTAYGPTISGEKMEIGLLSFPPGTEAKPHAHPNEQFMIVLKGRGLWNVGGEEKILGPGEVVFNPPNVEHSIKVLDEELEVINCKDVVADWSVKNAKWEK
ncbi:MAG: dimethylsulfonioproprionate lyase family protein [Pseudomonadota bacterium]